ncbi:CBS domain-containing protein [Streptomyces sp. PvR034]|uniref:CBS domain-containing protein n=1 Tax=Streptomyces sp. PvR034 TaxID=3156401 RepID=UPI00339A4241
MSHRTVADVMTRDVATASPEASLKAVVWSLDHNGVSALPIVDTRHHPIGLVSEADLLRRQAGLPDTGTLVGIVSRSDLLRPMLRHDDAMRDEVVDDVLRRTLRMTPGGVAVTVREGAVSLSGQVVERSTVPASRTAVPVGRRGRQRGPSPRLHRRRPVSGCRAEPRHRLSPSRQEAERARPLLADPDCAVHGHQPLLRILSGTLSVNFRKARLTPAP